MAFQSIFEVKLSSKLPENKLLLFFYLLIGSAVFVFVIGLLALPPVWKMNDSNYVVRFQTPGGFFENGHAHANWVASESIPAVMKNMLISSEDFQYGSSTITRQVVRSIYLGKDPTYLRKMQDIAGSTMLESVLSKDEILAWYLNVIKFGENVFGVKQAARFYFAKETHELTSLESTQLIVAISNPKKYGEQLTSKKFSEEFQSKTIELAWKCVSSGCLSNQEFAELITDYPGSGRFIDLMIRYPKFLRKNPEVSLRKLAKMSEESFRKMFPTKGAKPWRIAIDPGHFGGNYASIEGREIVLNHDDQEYMAREGEVSLAIALELEQLLRRGGYQVMLTRREIGKGAIKETFNNWVKKHAFKPLHKMSAVEKTYAFDMYNQDDLRARLKAIHHFNPDLAISVHLNARGLWNKKEFKLEPAKENYSIIFVPKQNSLYAQQKHRRLPGTNYELSVEYAKHLADYFRKYLNVRLQSDPEYENSYLITEGIYGRELTLTNQSQVPIVFGEPLFLDNPYELARISDKVKTSDTGVNERTFRIAKAYYMALVKFFEAHNKTLAH